MGWARLAHRSVPPLRGAVRDDDDTSLGERGDVSDLGRAVELGIVHDVRDRHQGPAVARAKLKIQVANQRRERGDEGVANTSSIELLSRYKWDSGRDSIPSIDATALSDACSSWRSCSPNRGERSVIRLPCRSTC